MVGFAFGVNFDRANLQPFLVDVARHAGPETGARSADIDPMSAHRQEAEQLPFPEKRRVDHHIVQMLAADLRMID